MSDYTPFAGSFSLNYFSDALIIQISFKIFVMPLKFLKF